MKYKEQIRIVVITYLLTAIVAYCLRSISHHDPLLDSLVDSLKVTTILTSFWWLHSRYLWKAPILGLFFKRIDLGGTWIGHYESIKLPDGQPIEGKIAIRIVQSFLDVHITSYTEKYHNYSYSEELRYDEKSQIFSLVYSYSQKEENINDTSSRNGTADLRVLTGKGNFTLKGEFWTIEGTRGKLTLERVSKTKTNSFADAYQLASQHNQ